LILGLGVTHRRRKAKVAQRQKEPKL
jgi:hypothetical protein